MSFDAPRNESRRFELQRKYAATIVREGAPLATVRKTRTGLHHEFEIDLMEDGAQLHAHGHFSYYEYEIKRDGDVIATVSKRWSRLADTYGVEIRAGEDEALLLTATVALAELARH
jgi:uncharacterized protein YxjI